MQITIKLALVVSLVLVAPTAAFCDFFTQIPVPYSTKTYSGSTSAASMYDTNPVSAPDLPLVAVAYDNFQFANAGILDTIAWTGAYENPAFPHASGFLIGLYQDNAGQPGAQLQQFNINNTANETALVGNHFSYSTSVLSSAATVLPNTKYWLSIAARIPYQANTAWGWAFSNAPTDNNSYQDTQTGPLNPGTGFFDYQRFNDPVDYSFSVSTAAVPEPSSCLLLAGALGGLAVKKLRKRRQKVAA